MLQQLIQGIRTAARQQRIQCKSVPQVTLLALIMWCVIGVANSQATQSDGSTPNPSEPQSNEVESFQLTLPSNTPLPILVDYVSDRIGINILYDNRVASTRINLKSPDPIPTNSLLPLLKTVLRAHGFLLIHDENSGLHRIVPIDRMTAVASIPKLQSQPKSPNDVETQVFLPEHAPVAALEAFIRPFLTPEGANVITDQTGGRIIITDLRANLKRIESLIDRLDKPGQAADIAFITLKHAQDAEQVGQVLESLLTAKQQGNGTSASKNASQLIIQEEPRTGRLVLIGSPDQIAEARDLISELDIDLQRETQVFPLRHFAAGRAAKLIERIVTPGDVEPSKRGLLDLTADEEGGLLIVTATPELLEQVGGVIADLDVAQAETGSAIRFYKLQNANAAEVLATIRSVEGAVGEERLTNLDLLGNSRLGSSDSALASAAKSEAQVKPKPDERNRTGITTPLAVRSDRVTVAADQNTNSLIVIAEPAVQRIYQKLIERLDVRRPQVMIEATIVTIDTSESSSLGVEIKAGDDSGDNQTFAFSRFGLSEISEDGRLDLIPGLGFNGAVLQADVADVVIRALRGDSRAKVVSAPKLLINDNATGSISSVSEQPVTSINQGQNTDTVTFSEFVAAGTSIEVTPRIAEGDYLRMEFDVSLDSFTGSGSGGIPPPRQSNTVSSEVTVPDGATIVVGGINRKDESEAISRIPILGEIPLVESLFSSRNESNSESTLFVFLRPVILRDDQFADLKYLSRRDLNYAEVPANSHVPITGDDSDVPPASSPTLIR